MSGKRSSDEHHRAAATWKRDAFVAAAAGTSAAALTAAASFAIGRVTGGEARVLVEAVIPTSRFLCSAVLTATATILALMLTLLGLTIRSDQDLDSLFFKRVKQIAFYDMLVMVTSVCFLVVHCIPITKSDSLPAWWYPAVYYSQLTISAVIAGAMISIVVMLYATLREVIHVLGFGDDQLILRNSDSEADESGAEGGDYEFAPAQ